MENITVNPRIEDGDWNEHIKESFVRGTIQRVGCLPNATDDGRAAFEMLIDLPNGKQVLVETTWRNMNSAIRALRGRWGDEGFDILEGKNGVS